MLTALGPLLEKGRRNVPADRVDVTSSSTSNDAAESVSSRSDDSDSPKIRRLSPDSTAASVDMNPCSDAQHFLLKMEKVSEDELASCQPSLSSPVTSKCNVQALICSIHHQLCEAEHRRTTAAPVATLLPPSDTESCGAMPDLRLVVDEALLELAAEARQIPALGSEREALVEQVTRSVMDAHIKTCGYTRERVDTGFRRYLEVCCGSQTTSHILSKFETGKTQKASRGKL